MEGLVLHFWCFTDDHVDKYVVRAAASKGEFDLQRQVVVIIARSNILLLGDFIHLSKLVCRQG